MEKGKIRIDKHFFQTWMHHREQGWILSGITPKDTDGYFWFILKRNR